MPLKARYESEDEIPESERDFYREAGEGQGFVLDVESVGSFGLADTRNLKESRRKESEFRVNAEKKANELQRELEDVRSELEKISTSKKTEEEKKREELESRERQLSEKYETQVKELRQQISSYESEIDQATRGNAIKSAIAKFGGKPHLLEPILDRRTKTVKDEKGNRRTVVLSQDGATVRVSPNPESSEDMSVEELLSEMKSSEEWDACFYYDGKSGGGGSGSDSVPSSPQTRAPKTISSSDQKALTKYESEIAKGLVEVVD